MTHDKKSAGSDPAFPTGADTYTAKWSVDGGLTKRQLLAGMAMQGMVANGPGIDRLWSTSLEISHDFNARTRWVTLMVAQRAVEVADAVLDLVETPSEADGGTGQSKNG